MRSRFSVAGHPLHPLLVTVPIGLFLWAFVADLVYLVSDDRVWHDISFWSGIGGIVAAVLAAVPGFGDYLTMAVDSNARLHATAHMLLNVAVVVLFLAAAIVMRDDRALEGGALTTTVILHGLGVGLLAAAGVLGGEMVYRHHLAVIPDDAEVERGERERHTRRPDQLEA
ncbi:MAG: DUF2231 domain-containing protein [Dehalococcoidia bacterium]